MAFSILQESLQPFEKLNELSYEAIERVVNVNFYGTVNIIKSFLPHLLKNETKTLLVNVSSMGGFLPVTWTICLWCKQSRGKIINRKFVCGTEKIPMSKLTLFCRVQLPQTLCKILVLNCHRLVFQIKNKQSFRHKKLVR